MALLKLEINRIINCYVLSGVSQNISSASDHPASPRSLYYQRGLSISRMDKSVNCDTCVDAHIAMFAIDDIQIQHPTPLAFRF